jgi:ubiquinone/menaquinone biosynthesis C-methylase UbiE
MRDLSLGMLGELHIPAGARCIDLTCGTGFVTAQLACASGTRATGVDASEGMLAEARHRHAECDFVQSDALAFLRRCESSSADVITCAWGLGYTRPLSVIRQAAKVLRPGGCLAIIDNSLFSLAEVLWASTLAFAENPRALRHVMKVRFLPSKTVLAGMMRLSGLRVAWQNAGKRTYHAASGQDAIARLQSTGAAAGFEFATDESTHDELFGRFAQIMERKYGTPLGVPITHRYLAAIGYKGSA